MDPPPPKTNVDSSVMVGPPPPKTNVDHPVLTPNNYQHEYQQRNWVVKQLNWQILFKKFSENIANIQPEMFLSALGNCKTVAAQPASTHANGARSAPTQTNPRRFLFTREVRSSVITEGKRFFLDSQSQPRTSKTNRAKSA